MSEENTGEKKGHKDIGREDEREKEGTLGVRGGRERELKNKRERESVLHKSSEYTDLPITSR